MMRLLDPSSSLAEKQQALHDLDMSRLLCRIDSTLTEEKATDFLNTYLCNDPQEILLRSQLLQEFSENCTLEELSELSVMLGRFPAERHHYEIHEGKLQKLLYRYRRIHLYVDCILKLTNIAGRGFSSFRMKEIGQECGKIASDAEFFKLQERLKKTEELIRFPRTIEAAINTNQDARGESIGIIRVSPEEREEHPLVGCREEDPMVTGLFGEMPYQSALFGTHMEEYLVASMEKEWKKPLAKALELWEKVSFPDETKLEKLSDEFAFYCLGLKVMNCFSSRNYPICRPQMADQREDLLMEAQEMIYPELTFRTESIQGNPVSISSSNSAVITGANHSGKTSYLKTIGQNLLLAQLGFFAVAKSMKLNPVKNIYTLFSAGEDQNMTASRMGVEIRLLAEMTQKANAGDLVIINEPLTSTNPLEAITICSDLIRTFLKKKVPCLMVTHLYDVYFILRSSLQEDLQSHLKSLVTCSRFNEKEQKMNYDYALMESEPLGNSYARETALAYGITLEEMIRNPQELSSGSRFCRQEEEHTTVLTMQKDSTR